MAIEPPYCTVGDLHITDSVMLPPGFDPAEVIESAASDMDAVLGFVYILPFDSLLTHEVKLLKQINAKLASGRILLMLYGEGDGEAMHAYGLRLLSEAEDKLMALANGLVDLTATRNTGPDLDATRGPSIKNADDESAVEQFERRVLRGVPTYWMPGSVP